MALDRGQLAYKVPTNKGSAPQQKAYGSTVAFCHITGENAFLPEGSCSCGVAITSTQPAFDEL